MITVTKPFLPSPSELWPLIQEIHNSGHITNNGPKVKLFEKTLQEYLGTPYCSLVNNGTIALMIAIRALNLRGSIITTPFSYIATASSIVWQNCEPIFVDIQEHDFNINPFKIAEKIRADTTAILTTHVFGVSSNLEEIIKIAKHNKLKVIYDGAHCFGVNDVAGNSLLNNGDISTTSFHATKLFNCVEGGLIVSANAKIHEKVKSMRNFGHNGPFTYATAGINGKLSEIHAAYGLINFKYLPQILNQRKKQYLFYKENLKSKAVVFQKLPEGYHHNYSYFPIVIDSEVSLNKIKNVLETKNIGTRRYFYPSINTIRIYPNQSCPVSEDISSRILCLPLYHDLTKEDQEMICAIINNSL